MNMVPYHEIDKPEYLVIQFPSYPNVLMIEHYCSDFDCDCHEVLLTFTQLNESRRPSLELVQIRMDYIENRILETIPKAQGVNADEIVETFHRYFHQFQSHIKGHHQKVKQHISDFQGKKLPPQVMELIRGDNCVPYQKIFGPTSRITFNYNSQNYILEDQYCMKPTCTCDEVVLVVYKEKAMLFFVYRLSFKDRSVELVKMSQNPDYEAIVNYLSTHEMDTFKSRYERMKKVGERFLS